MRSARDRDAMKFEIFINAATVVLGLATLIVSWRRTAS
jgi:hypothetical protein